MVRSLVPVVYLAACGFHSSTEHDSPVDAAALDAATLDAVPADAAPPGPNVRFRVEAETYGSATMPTTHYWGVVTTEPGYSGVGYMQCQPDDGAACEPVAKVPGCSASLSYAFAVAEPTIYVFQARMLARTGADDSIWYGIDGVPQPMELVVPRDAAWHWVTGASLVIDAGPHTLTLWQRECGARVDAVALTTSQAPPP